MNTKFISIIAASILASVFLCACGGTFVKPDASDGSFADRIMSKP